MQTGRRPIVIRENTQEFFMKLAPFIFTFLLIFLSCRVSVFALEPMVAYTALSDDARSTGQLALYENAPVNTHTIKSGKSGFP